MKKRTCIMTIARTFFLRYVSFSHDHRFGVLPDLLQFLARENSSIKMNIKNIKIILERLLRITWILISLIRNQYFRALSDSPIPEDRYPRK